MSYKRLADNLTLADEQVATSRHHNWVGFSHQMKPSDWRKVFPRYGSGCQTQQRLTPHLLE